MSTLGRLVVSSENHLAASHKSRMLFKTHVLECTVLHLDKRTHMFAPEPLIIDKMVRLKLKYFKPKTERKESRKRPRRLEKSRQRKHERQKTKCPRHTSRKDSQGLTRKQPVADSCPLGHRVRSDTTTAISLGKSSMAISPNI